jgi:hypothetical protein
VELRSRRYSPDERRSQTSLSVSTYDSRGSIRNGIIKSPEEPFGAFVYHEI